jgi:hypothetical protein
MTQGPEKAKAHLIKESWFLYTNRRETVSEVPVLWQLVKIGAQRRLYQVRRKPK